MPVVVINIVPTRRLVSIPASLHLSCLSSRCVYLSWGVKLLLIRPLAKSPQPPTHRVSLRPRPTKGYALVNTTRWPPGGGPGTLTTARQRLLLIEHTHNTTGYERKHWLFSLQNTVIRHVTCRLVLRRFAESMGNQWDMLIRSQALENEKRWHSFRPSRSGLPLSSTEEGLQSPCAKEHAWLAGCTKSFRVREPVCFTRHR